MQPKRAGLEPEGGYEMSSKYIVDDPWLDYLELPQDKRDNRHTSPKTRRALNKRIARFRRSRQTRPFRKIQ